MRRWLGVFVGALVVAACSSSKDDPNDAADGARRTDSAPRSACSTGAPYASMSSELTTAEVEAFSGAPECVPRCGEQKQETSGPYGSTWTTAALPSGACSSAGEACSMSAVTTRACPDGTTAACSFTGYYCRCESGSWRCYHGPLGASACVCNLDAGRD